MSNVCFGSKATSGLYQPLIAMMPPHATFIESHLGTGAIMKRKPPALRNIGIDLDRRCIDRFSCTYPVELVHGCCHAYLNDFSYDGDELIFADPPYLRSTRKAPERYRYRHDYDDQDHVELLGILKSVPCRVMVCGYSSELYDDMLSDWNTIALQVMNQAGVVTERVWFNYTADRVHWCRHAGRNFTDRQRIRRKAQGWGRRYGAMPHAERVAVLAEMMAVEAEMHDDGHAE